METQRMIVWLATIHVWDFMSSGGRVKCEICEEPIKMSNYFIAIMLCRLLVLLTCHVQVKRQIFIFQCPISSGHEAAFAAFLCCLCKVGALRVDDQLAIVFKVFNRWAHVDHHFLLQPWEWSVWQRGCAVARKFCGLIPDWAAASLCVLSQHVPPVAQNFCSL